jgi:preprotein translocase SecE subunit
VVEDTGDAGQLIKKLDPKDKDQVQIVSPGAGFQAGEIKTAQQYREALKKRIDADGQALDSATKARLEKELDDKDISEILNLPGSSDAAVAAIGQAALLTLPPPGLPAAELRLNQYALRNLNDQLHREYVRVESTGLSTELKRGAVIPASQFDEAASKFSNPDDKPTKAVPFAATGPVAYDRLTLLPALQYTLPLLLIAAALWGAWRVVNYPPFGDFLIATEAELNKVSWTSRSRLIQDTIVVLVTTFLLAVFLFLMDQTWRVVLSWKPIGVLQISEDQGEKNKNVEQKPW